MAANIYAAWIAILAGIIAGAVSGTFFHDEQFLGGYDSWSRRLTRLGHIAFFGLGLINLCFALTAKVMAIQTGLAVSSVLLIISVIAMPLVCYLAAFRKYFRHLFVIPVLTALAGVALFVWRLVTL